MDVLKNKTALITGGTSGMGAATAKRFLAEGATVIVTGSTAENVENAKKEMPGIEVLLSDAGNAEATKALVDQVKEKHGRLDVLFINAGIAKMGPSEEVDEAFFDSVFNTNVRGAYFLLKHAIPVLADGGSVILTSSTGAIRGYAGLGIYNATKAALSSFRLTFAVELAPRRIRVNTIMPGSINTGLVSKSNLNDKQKQGFKEMIDKTPLKRAGEPEEIAAAALYLACDESKFTTGSELRVDGGITAT